MEVTGFVVNINNKDKIAYIKTKRPDACAHCHSAESCHEKNVEMSVINNANAKIGDKVIVDINQDYTSYLLIGYIFIIPLVIFFLTIFLYGIYNLLALLCLPLCALYFIFLKVLNKKYKNTSSIVKIMTDE
ncbi:MAG: Positive regulator of sigma(E), RseC/MucC [Clostridia bacterium]|nr:Positive regulator of sigma(E), RseC/MucC [Clostridia bacterium]